ncbi:MAG: hypothetical protein I8H66_00025 [Sphingobacteriia bacterium]|nr:hypothetical protein [Sphingobacteriia bacterium]
MFKILFWCLLIYLGYRFIFELVIPVSRTAGQLKKKMAEMQEQQAFQQQYTRQSSGQTTQQPQSGGATGNPGRDAGRDDYIDFEEIK